MISNDKDILKAGSKILLTGGSGVLGTALRKIEPNIIAPSHNELDITNAQQCKEIIAKYNSDIIIHAAGYTDVANAENDKEKCKKINVDGTRNIAQAVFQKPSFSGDSKARLRRLVYISTDYVFDGEIGNYKENDPTKPVNYYALTKLQGEDIIKKYPNTLIIRTAFKPDGPWPYSRAFVDQYSSHEFVSVIAPQILQAALMDDLTGVIHIAGNRKRIYDLAKIVSPEVGQMHRSDVAVRIPKDTSLNIDKWKKIQKTSLQ
jgi:dTDP-4-dehydrorhamnose reductase